MRRKLENMISAVVCILAMVIILIAFSDPASAKPVLKAYFNGQEATVENVTLMVDEPFDIDVYVTSDQDGTVGVNMNEPGVDMSYKRIDGDKKGVTIAKDFKAGETVHFHWVLAANGEWADGTAPVNIAYVVFGPNNERLMEGDFSVVDAYISREHYKGTSAIGGSGNSTSKLAVGPEVTPIALLAAFLIARRRR